MSDASPVAPAPLDQAEKARLVRLERTVDRAVEVAGKIAGEALATIRDEKLYRTTHSTWEAYLRDRFGLARSTAHDMIAAATAPQRREVEGSSGGRTNPQPTRDRGPEPEEPRGTPPSWICPSCGSTRRRREREVIDCGDEDGWLIKRGGKATSTCLECGHVEPDPQAKVDPRAAGPPMPPAAPRLWAVVERVDHPLFASLPGALVLGYEPGDTAELPAAGTRVLVAWER